jgi:hypothetical protein
MGGRLGRPGPVVAAGDKGDVLRSDGEGEWADGDPEETVPDLNGLTREGRRIDNGLDAAGDEDNSCGRVDIVSNGRCLAQAQPWRGKAVCGTKRQMNVPACCSTSNLKERVHHREDRHERLAEDEMKRTRCGRAMEDLSHSYPPG